MEAFTMFPQQPKGHHTTYPHMPPIMAHLGGIARANDQGRLVFLFPALARIPVTDSDDDKEYWEEPQMVFSPAPQWETLLALGLGVFNLLLVAIWPVAVKMASAAREHGLVHLANRLHPFLTGYAVLYLAVPALRFVFLTAANRRIVARNNLREVISTRFEALRAQPGMVQETTQAARAMGETMAWARDGDTGIEAL
mmetsp:Transcript_53232/g.115597  ORF Transcript_53232/g.115597 Transcript_53232/m.115597 type:complete len:197 (+) Transcript_53232:140-730(+)